MSEPARRYTQITKAVYERPWAITPSMLAVIEEIIRFRAAGAPFTDEEIEARVAAAQTGPRRGGLQAQSVAVIPIYGVISKRMDLMTAMSGGTSVEGITGAFRDALANPEVGAIIFDVDSPGGSVEGITELANEIRSARGQKPMAAVANTMMASAAYWIASGADELSASPSSMVGSVGIIAMHVDVSAKDEMLGEKYTFITAGDGKADGNEHKPLSDSARDDLQADVNDYYALFTGDVAAGRGVKASVISGDWKAQFFTAKKAKTAGLVDRVETLDATVKRLVAKVQPTLRLGAGASHSDLTALALGQSYSERLALASALATDLAASTDRRIALRAEEGRGLSEDNRSQLLALSEHLGAMAARADEPGSEQVPVPDPVPPDPEPSAKRIGLVVFEAAMAGGYRLNNEVPNQ